MLGEGRLMAKFPKLADMHNKPYWMLFGLDQLLHLLILVAIFLCLFSFRNYPL